LAWNISLYLLTATLFHFVSTFSLPYMKSFLLTKFLPGLIIALVATAVAVAQPGSGGPMPGDPPVNPTPVPIDGGVSLLLAGGVAYGIKRLRDRRKA
jgi:hypothetical protein